MTGAHPQQRAQAPVELGHPQIIFRCARLDFGKLLELFERFGVLILFHQRLREPVQMSWIVGIFISRFAVGLFRPGIILGLGVGVAEEVVHFGRRRTSGGVGENLHRLLRAAFVDQELAQLFERRAITRIAAQDIAQKLGVTFRVSIDKRIAGAEAVGAHKTSMLQDVEAGRSLETEALIGSILEMAKLTNTPAPAIQSVYALVKLLNKVMLLEGGGVKVEKISQAA